MRRAARFESCSLAAAALLCWSVAASAASGDAELSTRLRLHGDTCSNQVSLERSVASRSRRVRFVRHGPSHHDVRVRVAAPRDREPWKVEVIIDGDSPARRLLEADNCEDLMDAVALVIALSLDPPQALASRAPEEASDASPSSSPRRNAGPPIGAGNRGSSRGGVSERQRSELVSLGAVADGGVAPGWLPGVALSYHALWSGTSTLDLAPALGVSANYARRGGFTSAAGEASFQMFTVEVQGCPLRLGTSALALLACAWFEAGGIWVRGERTVEPEQHRRPWLAAGPGLLLQASSSDRVALTLDVGLGVPLVRDTFQFDSADPIVLHRVGPWAGQAGVRVGYVLP